MSMFMLWNDDGGGGGGMAETGNMMIFWPETMAMELVASNAVRAVAFHEEIVMLLDAMVLLLI